MRAVITASTTAVASCFQNICGEPSALWNVKRISLDISRVSPTWASVTAHKAYRWAQDHGLEVEKPESHQNAYEPRTASLENLSGIGIPDVVKMAGRAKPVARAGQ